jgi:hypothetical protein
MMGVSREQSMLRDREEEVKKESEEEVPILTLE